MPARKRSAEDSRQRVFEAAAREFAARGYAGANVDRIARAARLNKAMIYYHFGSKAALYRAIVADMFDAVGARVREVAASSASPADKVRAFVAAIDEEASLRPHFPPIWLREVAEGGEHVDTATLSYARAVLAALASIIREGVEADRFRPLEPVVVHGAIVAPLMFFICSTRIRRKFARAGVPGVSAISREAVVEHVQRLALAALEGRV